MPVRPGHTARPMERAPPQFTSRCDRFSACDCCGGALSKPARSASPAWRLRSCSVAPFLRVEPFSPPGLRLRVQSL